MELARTDPSCPADIKEAMKDCEPTIAFILRVHRLIKAMTSRSSGNALYEDDGCESKVVR